MKEATEIYTTAENGFSAINPSTFPWRFWTFGVENYLYIVFLNNSLFEEQIFAVAGIFII
jgi:hypothetical protein